MRVTEGRLVELATESLTQAKDRIGQAANEASSGVRVTKPSDDPAAWIEGARARARLVMSDARKSAIGRASERLRESEQALVAATEIMTQAQEIAVQLGSDQYNANERAAAAERVNNLRASLLAQLNARSSAGESLFAGSLTATAAFSAAGAYQGDTASQSVETADDDSIDTALPGDQLSGGSGVDLFSVLDALAAALQANDGPTIRATLDNIKLGLEQIVDGRAEIGRQHDALISAEETRAAMHVELDAKLTRAVGADPIDAASSLARAGVALEAARASASKIIELVSGRG